jgi:hypothetical protein
MEPPIMLQDLVATGADFAWCGNSVGSTGTARRNLFNSSNDTI